MDTNQRIHDFDDFALDMINIKATQLVGKAGFTLDDIEDIKQAMTLDLLKRLKKYDPAKSNFKLFVTCVIDRRGQNLIRHRESEMRDHRREDCSLNESVLTADNEEPVERLTTVDQDDQDIRTGKYHRPAEERMQMQLDVETVLAGLPADLRRVALMLQTKPVAEVARELGIPRRTFRQTYVAQLRQAFSATGLDLYVA